MFYRCFTWAYWAFCHFYSPLGKNCEWIETLEFHLVIVMAFIDFYRSPEWTCIFFSQWNNCWQLFLASFHYAYMWVKCNKCTLFTHTMQDGLCSRLLIAVYLINRYRYLSFFVINQWKSSAQTDCVGAGLFFLVPFRELIGWKWVHGKPYRISQSDKLIWYENFNFKQTFNCGYVNCIAFWRYYDGRCSHLVNSGTRIGLVAAVRKRFIYNIWIEIRCNDGCEYRTSIWCFDPSAFCCHRSKITQIMYNKDIILHTHNR